MNQSQKKGNSIFKNISIEDIITKWSFSKSLLLLTLIFFIFKEEIEGTIFKTIVEKVFSKFPMTTTTNYLFWFVIIWLVLYYAIKLYNNYITSKKTLWILLYLSCFYLYYLKIDKHYVFTPISKGSPFNYWGIIFWLFLLNVIILLHEGLTWFKQRYYSEKDNILLDDEPIEDDSKDILRLKPFVKNASNLIVNSKSNYTLAFGITGEWGIGKTSFINLIKRNLEDNRDIVFIDFNPWQSIGKNTIVDTFFSVIDSKISKHSSGISKLLLNYKEDILSLNEGIVSKALSKGFAFFENGDIEEQIERIDTILKKIEKQFIIVIDDVDRLAKDEIVLILKLIRNFHKFSNIKFIVAYDRKYVINAVKNLNEIEAENYIDKIFVYNFQIPPVKRSLNNILYENLSSIFKDEKESLDYLFKSKDVFGRPSGSNQINDNFNNIREVKRFVNFFHQSYKQVKNEIFFVDFIHIEMIRFSYPDIYNLLYNQKNEFFGNPHSDFDNNTKNLELIKDKDNNYKIKVYLLENMNRFNANENDIETIKNILVEVFYREHTKLNNGHLNIKKNFDRYFYFRVFDFEISEKEFYEVINSDSNDLKSVFNNWVSSKKISSVVERIKILNKEKLNNKVQYENIVKILYLNANYCDEYNEIIEIKGYLNKSFIHLYDIEFGLYKFWISELKQNDNNNTNSILMRTIAKDLIEKKRGYINFLFSSEHIEYFNEYYFDEYFNENEFLDVEHFNLAYNCFDIKESKSNEYENETIFKYKSSIFIKLKTKVLEYPSKFLIMIIYSSVPQNVHGIRRHWIENLFNLKTPKIFPKR